MLILPALGAVNSIYHGRLLQAYVRQTKSINDIAALAGFQKIVARQMYAALAQLVFLVTPIIIYSFGVSTEILVFSDITLVIIPGAFLVALGYLFKKVEAEACRIPAAGEDLDEQRLAVIKTWRTRPLPNW
jgi:uncharacterized membrane protein